GRGARTAGDGFAALAQCGKHGGGALDQIIVNAAQADHHTLPGDNVSALAPAGAGRGNGAGNAFDTIDGNQGGTRIDGGSHIESGGVMVAADGGIHRIVHRVDFHQPHVTVSIHQTGGDHLAAGVHDLCAVGYGNILAHGGNFAVHDQHGSVFQHAGLAQRVD